MKSVMLIAVLFIAAVLVVYSQAQNDNDEQLSQMNYRQVEEDDQSADSQDGSHENVEIVRRKSSQCEPCGALRRPCCFPNLCRRRPRQISKCYKV